MDYGAIVKEAWRVTWRYKILWIFGLFVGAGSGSTGGSSNYSTSGTDFPAGTSGLPQEFVDFGDQFSRWAEANVALLISLAVVFVLVGIVFWIVSVAARGGLIHLVSEAEDMREVRAGAGWSAGFARWWSMFGVRFVLYAPFAIVIFVILMLTLLPWLVASSSTSDALVPGLFGACGAVIVLFLVLVVLGFVVSLVAEFAERHVMLDGLGTLESIGAGWRDLRAHFKDVLLMWLLALVIGIGFGILLLIAFVVLAVTSVFAFLAAGPCGGALVALALFALLLVPGAIYGTFVSALWTIFWREMTGRGRLTPRLESAQAPYAGVIPAPPAPPAG